MKKTGESCWDFLIMIDHRDMQQKALALFLLPTLLIGFLALENLHYHTIYGNIKFNEKPDPNQVSGKISHLEKKYELMFSCRINEANRSVSLTDVYKNVIIKYLHSAHDISYIQMGQYHFIADAKTGKIMHLPNPDLIPNEQESKSHLDLYNQIEKLGKSNISIKHVFEKTAQKYEHIMAEELSRALGEVFGQSGSEFPCVMELHTVARTLIHSLLNLQVGADANINEHKEKRGTCSNKRSLKCGTRPIGSNCIGMCGLGRYCWKWVCGSCCLHRGCYDHDICCAQHGYWSFKCLFPVGFRCRGYTC